MADSGRWFKLWCSCASDPSLDNLPIADFGRWAKLGAIIKEQGTNGVLVISEPSRLLCAALQVASFDVLIHTIETFPNVSVSSETNTSVSFRIEFHNWAKYQGDFSTYRVHKHRDKIRQSETPKKRREEKRTPIVPVGLDGFVDFWALYPRRAAKQAAIKAWVKLNPSNDLRVKLMKALAIQVQKVFAGREPDKIPHAATWLNGGRWEDEIPTNGHGNHAPQQGVLPETWKCAACGGIHLTPPGQERVCLASR